MKSIMGTAFDIEVLTTELMAQLKHYFDVCYFEDDPILCPKIKSTIPGDLVPLNMFLKVIKSPMNYNRAASKLSKQI